jgi:hypothetical protein
MDRRRFFKTLLGAVVAPRIVPLALSAARPLTLHEQYLQGRFSRCAWPIRLWTLEEHFLYPRYKIGATFSIRRPQRFRVSSGTMELKPGDVFTMAGSYVVNPKTR